MKKETKNICTPNKLTYGTRRVNKLMSLEISLIITNCFLNTASLVSVVEDKDRTKWNVLVPNGKFRKRWSRLAVLLAALVLLELMGVQVLASTPQHSSMSRIRGEEILVSESIQLVWTVSGVYLFIKLIFIKAQESSFVAYPQTVHEPRSSEQPRVRKCS